MKFEIIFPFFILSFIFWDNKSKSCEVERKEAETKEVRSFRKGCCRKG